VEISGLFREGRKFPSGSFTLYWQPAEQFKWGVFLSRRHGPASLRNRLKRLYREAIRQRRDNLSRNGRIAVVPRMTGANIGLEQIVKDVDRVFERINNES